MRSGARRTAPSAVDASTAATSSCFATISFDCYTKLPKAQQITCGTTPSPPSSSRLQAVRVTFERERPRDFDLLVGADGLHSNVRRLVFGDEAAHVRSFGIGIAIFSTPNLLQLRDWQFSHRDAASGYVLYPNLDNSELRVNLGFALLSTNEWRGAVSTQKALVAERCAHMRWQIPRLLEAMRNSKDFYFGDIAQVKMPGWSSGRVVLLGDAAYCPSPFSGQGTSLALVGAYVLARELQRTPADISAAFQRYESRMRPYVELNQALVDLDRAGLIPDEIMNTAKNGMTFDQGDTVGLRPIIPTEPID